MVGGSRQEKAGHEMNDLAEGLAGAGDTRFR